MGFGGPRRKDGSSSSANKPTDDFRFVIMMVLKWGSVSKVAVHDCKVSKTKVLVKTDRLIKLLISIIYTEDNNPIHK